MTIAWDDDMGYISYVRADEPVLLLFIVETVNPCTSPTEQNYVQDTREPSTMLRN